MYVNRSAQINAVKDILRVFKLRFKTFLFGVELAAGFVGSIQPRSQFVYVLLRNVGSEYKMQVVVIQVCNIVLNCVVIVEVHLGNIDISACQIPRKTDLNLLYLCLFGKLYKIICAAFAVSLSDCGYLTVAQRRAVSVRVPVIYPGIEKVGACGNCLIQCKSLNSILLVKLIEKTVAADIVVSAVVPGIANIVGIRIVVNSSPCSSGIFVHGAVHH